MSGSTTRVEGIAAMDEPRESQSCFTENVSEKESSMSVPPVSKSSRVGKTKTIERSATVGPVVVSLTHRIRVRPLDGQKSKIEVFDETQTSSTTSSNGSSSTETSHNQQKRYSEDLRTSESTIQPIYEPITSYSEKILSEQERLSRMLHSSNSHDCKLSSLSFSKTQPANSNSPYMSHDEALKPSSLSRIATSSHEFSPSWETENREQHRPMEYPIEGSYGYDAVKQERIADENRIICERLASSVRDLQSELTEVRQQSRLGDVRLESAEEDLSAMEKRLEQAHDIQVKYAKLVSRLEKRLDAEISKTRHQASVQIQLQKQLEQAQEQIEKHCLALSTQTQELSSAQQTASYWREYVHGVELALREMTTHATLQDKLLQEEKLKSLEQQKRLDEMTSTMYQFIHKFENVLQSKFHSIPWNLSPISSPASMTSSGELCRRMESVLSHLQYGVESMEENSVKQRIHVKQLLKIVKMYEKMYPKTDPNLYDCL